MQAVVVVVAAMLSAHNASQGTSAFVVDDAGKIAVSIKVLETDLPELCDVEINLADPARRLLAEQKLESCVAREFPSWLRLRADDVDCVVSAGRVEHGAGLQINLYADALCDPPARRSITLDWGLFQHTTLDHQSTSTLTLPDGSVHRALLSKRKNKLVVPVYSGPPAIALLGALLAIIAVMIAGVVVGRRRRRR
ncbi:MAG: hypothetical protein Q8O67_17910 [Deltaproteobacteria bacterium]|nr:hypothetical protein [Deltaproteobacteria bacterium]